SRAMSSSPRRAPRTRGSSAASRLAQLLDPLQGRLMTRLARGEAAVLRLESFDPFHARLAALPACGSSAASRLARLLDPLQGRLMTRLARGEAAVLRLESFDPFHARLAALLAGGLSAASRLGRFPRPSQAPPVPTLACR